MMSMIIMMIMHVWWWWWWLWCVSVGQEVQKKFVCWGSSQNLQLILSFFLWDPQAQCLTVSKFCFVLFCCCCCCWKPIFCGNQFYVSDYYYFLVNLMRILGSCLFFFFLSFSGFGFCRSLLPWEFQSRDVVVVTFWRFEELGIVALDYFCFCSWFVCLALHLLLVCLCSPSRDLFFLGLFSPFPHKPNSISDLLRGFADLQIGFWVCCLGNSPRDHRFWNRKVGRGEGKKKKKKKNGDSGGPEFSCCSSFELADFHGAEHEREEENGSGGGLGRD